MFDHVLNELVVISVVGIIIPAMIIATILMITGRRKHHHDTRIHHR